MITHLHVGFKVKDYEEWKKGYDASREDRKVSGESSFRVLRSLDDPNVVTVLAGYEDADKARAFMESPDLEKLMEEAGISDMGQMFVLEEMDSGTL